MKWRDFESAPRDGSQFLACTEPMEEHIDEDGPPILSRGVFMVYYHASRGVWCVPGGIGIPYRLTHWHLLPEPPPIKEDFT